MERQHLNPAKKAIAPPQTQSHASAQYSPHSIEELQSLIGNRAVNQLLAGEPVIRAKPLFRGISHELAIQAKLTIGAVGDKYEQEADRVAEQVVSQINTPAPQSSTQNQPIQREEISEEDDHLQMKPVVQRLASENGGAIAPDLETSIQQARGSGKSLPDNIRQPMEQAFGADFSGVKVHTDPKSDELNQSIQAKAFTTGQDVFFRQGTYQPGSRGGQELIAHELTHVVQQGATNRQAKALPSVVKEVSDITINNQNQISKMPGDIALLIQRNIETNGGKWTTDIYQTVEDGAEIILNFEPNETVKAQKIGLIQRSLKVERGINYDADARQKYESNDTTLTVPQKRKAQRSDGESHIDRDIKMNNPIYGAPNLATGKDLSATPSGKLDMSDKAQKAGTAQNYQLGWRYKSMLGMKNNKRSAKLYDKPNLPGATAAVTKSPDKKSQMTFETTAVCIEGEQKGTYYGSVKWGFEIQDQNGSSLLPLTKLTDDNPTNKMIGVMTKWNQGEFNPDQPNPQIPIPK